MESEDKEPRQISAGQAIGEPLDSPMRVLNKSQRPAKPVVFQISPAAQALLEEGERLSRNGLEIPRPPHVTRRH